MVRNHLLCPHADCDAHRREDEERICVLIDAEGDVTLKQSLRTNKKSLTKRAFTNNKKITTLVCPFCHKPIELVIDETHTGRDVYFRLPNRKVG